MHYNKTRTSILGACLLLGHLWGWPIGEAGTSAFQGSVTHIATNAPLVGARVSAGARSVLTDGQGRYYLSLPPGRYDVRAEADGMITMIHKDRTADLRRSNLDFEMVPLHPADVEQAAIEQERPLPRHDLPEDVADIAGGFGLSGVTSVPTSLRVLMPDGSVVVMAMDVYLKGVLPKEIYPYWPREALRAQAVAARSYAATRQAHLDVGAHVCTTTHCQVWGSTHYETTSQAVDDTHDVVGRYQGTIIRAFFFGHCDGHTRASEEVWGGYLPYCRSVSCPCGFTEMWGHGVGMCQYGVRAWAAQGAGYVDILLHYYNGIQVPAPSPTVTPTVTPTSTRVTGSGPADVIWMPLLLR